jgi:tetratricopeptide (TPR) repeat protein
MKRKGFVAGVLALLGLAVFCLSGSPAAAQDAQEQQKQPYTMAEYNALQAATKETNPQQRIKLLDDFVAKFPTSALMPYIDQAYIDTYDQLKDYPKVVEFADRLLTFGDKVQLQERLKTVYKRCQVFEFAYNPKDPDAKDQLSKARDAAALGLKLVGALPKPQNLTDEQFSEQKKPAEAFFNNAAGFASLQMKDYKPAEDSFKAALASDDKNSVTYYRLGLAYLQDNPPQSLDGFWALARSVALKGPGEAKVRDYLHNRLLVYQQPGCDNLIEPQMNELLQLASTSADRPTSFNIPSRADLDKILQASNIVSVLADLKGGGDKAKMTWLAVCGSEFPEVVGKVIDLAPGTDSVVLHVYTGATPEEMEAATAANMEVKLVGQPEASRLQKDDGVRFSGTLAGYDPEPFLLHWDKCKVNPEDIPAEKPEPGKRRPHRPLKKPGN